MARDMLRFGCGICLYFLASGSAYAIAGCDQDDSVQVTATAAALAEAGGATAQFVFATGLAGGATLTLSISGSASNGVDYQLIPAQVTIPALQTQTTVTLIPIVDAFSEGAETVTVTITATDSPCLHVGARNSATVYIVDGTSLQWDVFWRRSDGANATWQFTGPGVGELHAGFPAGVATDWQSETVADVNGDGILDVVWYHPASGLVAIWVMSSPVTVASVTFPASVGGGSGWNLVAAADVNADGRADLIWRNVNTGQLIVWYMSSAGQIASSRDYGTVPLSYELRGAGDVNADGTADLIWFEAADGQVAIWEMALDGSYTPAFPGAVGPGSWRPYRVADFDGDSKADIGWRNEANGMTAVWYLDGGSIADSDFLVTVPLSDWQVGTAADFNNDGRADLLWYAPATGDVVRWLMNGRHVTPTAEYVGSVGAGWQMLP